MTRFRRPLFCSCIGTLVTIGLSLTAGCTMPVNRPPGAPVLLMNETPTKNPAILQHQQYVQVQGTVMLHKGETVVLIPATQP